MPRVQDCSKSRLMAVRPFASPPGPAQDPVWSPDGSLIAYAGASVGPYAPLLATRPDGTPVEFPKIEMLVGGARARFLPGGKSLVGLVAAQDFWILDLETMKTRQLAHLINSATVRTFDITPDGKQIVFDRLRENSDIVLIDLPK